VAGQCGAKNEHRESRSGRLAKAHIEVEQRLES
jgi:hypothetical protein